MKKVLIMEDEAQEALNDFEATASDVVVLDGVEVVFIYGYTLHSIIGIETRHLLKIAVAVNLLRHNVMANHRA